MKTEQRDWNDGSLKMDEGAQASEYRQPHKYCRFGSRPLHESQYHNKVSHNLFAGGGSWPSICNACEAQ